MVRRRLRPAYSKEELDAMYDLPNDHRIGPLFDDHVLRVEATIELIEQVGHVGRAADLSCGNGVLLDVVDADEKFYGDYAAFWPITGPIEETIHQIPHVDLFLLCETLEHLDDPDAVLREIREKADCLILSTPRDEKSAANPEHYWGWGVPDVEQMLRAAGWSPWKLKLTKPRRGYRFQIWRCT